MTCVQRLAWVAVLFSCVAGVLQPYVSAPVPFLLFMVCIMVALVIMAIGLVITQRQWREVQEAMALQELWRQQRERSR